MGGKSQEGTLQDANGKSLLGFTASDLAISRQQTELRPCRKSTDFTGDFNEGTVQHIWVLHTKGSRPVSSNIIQEHVGQVWGHRHAGIKRKKRYTIKVVTWHSTLLNCKLNTSISAYSETGGLRSRSGAR